MHDIDAQISRISGQSDYMSQLQKVTGDIMSVNKDIYKERHQRISACDFTINAILKELSTTHKTAAAIAIFKEYSQLSSAINIRDGTFTTYNKKKKGKVIVKECIAGGHLPVDIIKSDWFKCLKRIEKSVHKYFTGVFHESTTKENRTYDKLLEELKKYPELMELHTVYDIEISSAELFKRVQQLSDACRTIVNQLLLPMYDVRGTITQHWSSIEKVFKSKAFQRMAASGSPDELPMTSPDDIIDMLEKFIIAKYRATVTGNNKHYVKLFLNTVGSDSVSNMDGSRFMEIMDAIDMDALNKDDKVYRFAMGAKVAMKKLITNDNINAEDLIRDFETVFSDSTSTTATNDSVKEPVDDRYNDII